MKKRNIHCTDQVFIPKSPAYDGKSKRYGLSCMATYGYHSNSPGEILKAVSLELWKQGPTENWKIYKSKVLHR